ncbi:MAG: hypothetical protein AABW67_05810 [Nanoarchaeota archaeon]
MEEVKFSIKTSEGERFSFSVPPCGSSFFSFQSKPYQEDPEFTNCLVLGSGGTIGSQIIIRAQPTGHKNSSIPHLNIDIAYWNNERQKRIRKNDIKTLKMAEWLEITQEFNDEKFFQKINLQNIES